MQVGENKGTVWVMRKDGCSANVSCKYKCEAGAHRRILHRTIGIRRVCINFEARSVFVQQLDHSVVLVAG